MRNPLLCPLLFGVVLTAPAAPAAAQRRAMDHATQVTHAENFDPSLSPDDRRMVYISVVSGREQLFVASVDGTESRQLTTDDANHEDPAWSPDGKRIAFVYVRGSLEIISVMDADGANVRRLTPETSKGIHPNWSADGRWLAYCTDDDLAPPRKNDADIRLIDMTTGVIRTVITGGINTYPSLSPDGRRIAFRKIVGDMNSEVFVADSDGGNLRNLTNLWAFDGWPAWSPDGSRIAFASNRNANYQVYVMRPDGSDVRLVANTEGRATAPQWSHDGTRLFFPVCLKADTGSDCEIYVARVAADGTSPSH